MKTPGMCVDYVEDRVKRRLGHRRSFPNSQDKCKRKAEKYNGQFQVSLMMLGFLFSQAIYNMPIKIDENKITTII